jgi:hypothetical protein
MGFIQQCLDKERSTANAAMLALLTTDLSKSLCASASFSAKQHNTTLSIANSGITS